jgi:fumarate reductase (CoM/CoB) subunit B
MSSDKEVKSQKGKSKKSINSTRGKNKEKERKNPTIADCSNCGLCKAVCPIFRILLEETKGPRGRAMLAKKDIKDEIFYLCTLCGSCKVSCPAGIDLPEEIRKMREKMVEMGVETEGNKLMIENVKKYGNPFGKVEKGKIPKDLYCC